MEQGRLHHMAKGFEDLNQTQCLPILIIRDPLHWMHSLVRARGLFVVVTACCLRLPTYHFPCVCDIMADSPHHLTLLLVNILSFL
jgi:hypothetical protein